MTESENEKLAFIAHGFADDYFTPWWRTVNDKFEEWGYDVINVRFDGIARTVDSPRKYAELVETEIEERYDELQEEYEGAEIVVVGHSMGGMVARYLIEKLGYEDEVDTLLTFGSPHQGTRVAIPFGIPLFGSEGARDLSPGSQFLQSLNKDGLSEEVDYAAVYTPNDVAIVPKKNARLPEPKPGDRNIRVGRSVSEVALGCISSLGGVTMERYLDEDSEVQEERTCLRRSDVFTGHLSMFYNDETWEEVADYLGEEQGRTVKGDVVGGVAGDLRWMAKGIVRRMRGGGREVEDDE